MARGRGDARQGTPPWPQGLHLLRSARGAYAYLVEDPEGGGPTLIDAGLPGRGPAILAELRALGVAPPRRIVVTHGDVDHVGSLAYLARETGATVWVPEGDWGDVMEGVPRPGVKRWLGAMIRPSPPAAAQRLAPGQQLGCLTALASPGHSPATWPLPGRDFLPWGTLWS